MPLTIRQYKDTDRTAWNNYVLNHPDGTLFHLTQWKEVVEKTFGHKSLYLTAEKTGNGSERSIVGILPLFHIKSFMFGNYFVSVPFAELGGPLSDSIDISHQLLNKAKTLSSDNGTDYIELRNRMPLDGYATKNLYYNFRREISQDLVVNMKAIPRKSRASVRNGIKKGLVSESGHHLVSEHYAIMAKSYHSLGTPIFPRKFFDNFLSAFENMVQILLVRTGDNTPIAAVMTFFFKDQVIPYWAGSIFEYRNLSPNDFMYWELMRHGCENGYRIFDYGRSKKGTGSFDFKRHWGFEPVQLAYQYHLNRIDDMPNLSPNNPKYKKKIEMWRKMPHFATKILGPPIAKYLA